MNAHDDHVELRSGAYADSVTLLQVSRDVAGRRRRARRPGRDGHRRSTSRCSTGWASTSPRRQPQRHGRRAAARRRRRRARPRRWPPSTRALRRRRPPAPAAPARSRRRAPPATALRARRPARSSLVSVPGASAIVEAMDALDAGRDVMVFSDNVPVEQEVALKRAAAERGAAGDGPRLRHRRRRRRSGSASPTSSSPGPVGIVAASGTGCQQLLALLDHAGVGVALGARRRRSRPVRRGRRRSPPARRCAGSTPTPSVELIVVVSKPPAAEVAAEIRGVRRGARHPGRVRAARARPARPHRRRRGGAAAARPRRAGLAGARRRRTAAATGPAAARAVRRRHHCAARRAIVVEALVGADGGPHLRRLRRRRLHRRPRAPDDRPDPAPRAPGPGRRRPGTGVLLLDVVLGHGAEPDPAAAARAGDRRRCRQPVVVAVVGTDARPAGPRPPGRSRWSTPAPRCTCPTPAPPAAPSSCSEERPMSHPRPPSSPSAPTCSPTPSRPRPSPSPASTGDRRCPAPRPTWSTVAADPLRAPTPTPARWPRCSASQATLVDVAPASEVLGLEPGQFLHAGPPIALGPRLRPAARRADGRRRPRGPGRRPRGRRRAVRVRHVGLPRAVPPPRRRRPDGRRGHPVDVDVGAGGPATGRRTLLLPQRGARQGAALRRLRPRGADPAALDGRRARPAAAGAVRSTRAAGTRST